MPSSLELTATSCQRDIETLCRSADSCNSDNMETIKRNILWIDCLGGLSVGAVMLLLSRQIANLDALPVSTVIAMAFANVVYGSFSLYVTIQDPRSQFLVRVLAVANMCWFLFCVLIVASNWKTISLPGILHVLGEGIYVGFLGFIEWRWRRMLGD